MSQISIFCVFLRMTLVRVETTIRVRFEIKRMKKLQSLQTTMVLLGVTCFCCAATLASMDYALQFIRLQDGAAVLCLLVSAVTLILLAQQEPTVGKFAGPAALGGQLNNAFFFVRLVSVPCCLTATIMLAMLSTCYCSRTLTYLQGDLDSQDFGEQFVVHEPFSLIEGTPALLPSRLVSSTNWLGEKVSGDLISMIFGKSSVQLADLYECYGNQAFYGSGFLAARPFYEKSLAIYLKNESWTRGSKILSKLSLIAITAQDRTYAKKLLDQSLRLLPVDSSGINRFHSAFTISILGAVAHNFGDDDLCSRLGDLSDWYRLTAGSASDPELLVEGSVILILSFMAIQVWQNISLRFYAFRLATKFSKIDTGQAKIERMVKLVGINLFLGRLDVANEWSLAALSVAESI